MKITSTVIQKTYTISDISQEEFNEIKDAIQKAKYMFTERCIRSCRQLIPHEIQALEKLDILLDKLTCA